MKHRITAFILGLAILLQFSCRQVQAQDTFLPELFEQFKYTSEQAIYEQHSYYNFTNRSSISPNINQFGVTAIFVPPYYFGPSEIDFKIFDNPVAVDRYVWYPSESVFKGKETNGVIAKARALPLYEDRGGIYEITLTNVSENTLDIPVEWSVKGILGKETNWGFSTPDIRFKEISMKNIAIDNIESGYRFVSDSAGTEMSMEGYDASYEHADNKRLKTRLSLKPGESVKTGVVFVLGQNNSQTKNTAAEIADDVPSHIAGIREGWENDLADIMQKAPRLEGVSGQMQKFYSTGLLNLLSVKWEVPDFIFSPWFAACGIDGGAMISYLWDMALPSKFVSLLSPEATRKHILAFANADMYDNYAVNPSTGKGVGPFYSYNYYALTLLVYDYASMNGDFSILDEPVGDATYQIFDALRTGVYTKEMEKAIVGHLNEKEFLSKWGVHSLSKQDPGYDPNDVDWGGPGIYTNDGPELMTDLFNAGFFEEGIDLLNRIKWWGDLPYYPQAMRAGTKGYREDGRANLISGVGISMHMAFGLFRMKVRTDRLEIHPIEHEFMKGVSLKGMKLRGKDIDVAVSDDGEHYTVSVNGEKNELASEQAFTVRLD